MTLQIYLRNISLFHPKMEYFWKQQDDIPYGMGYPLFGKAHILSILVTLSLVILLIYYFGRQDERIQKKVIRGIPVFMLFLEVFKDLFLLHEGRFGLGYLPLHACSIGIFVYLLREFIPWEKSRDFFGEVAYVFVMPGALAALIFPDWTVYYPVISFMNLYSYLWHGLLVLYPLLLMKKKEISPSIRHIYRVILFLCVVVPPIFLFDMRFDCNYFFLKRPVPNSPLEWLSYLPGKHGYLAGYAALALIMMVFVYFCTWITCRIWRLQYK